jgi:hypothetical protein
MTRERTWRDQTGGQLAPGHGLTSPAAGAKVAESQWFVGD